MLSFCPYLAMHGILYLLSVRRRLPKQSWTKTLLDFFFLLRKNTGKFSVNCLTLFAGSINISLHWNFGLNMVVEKQDRWDLPPHLMRTTVSSQREKLLFAQASAFLYAQGLQLSSGPITMVRLQSSSVRLGILPWVTASGPKRTIPKMKLSWKKVNASQTEITSAKSKLERKKTKHLRECNWELCPWSTDRSIQLSYVRCGQEPSDSRQERNVTSTDPSVKRVESGHRIRRRG